MDVALPFVLKNMHEKKLKTCGLINQLILVNFKICSNFSYPEILQCGIFQALCDPTAVSNTSVVF